MKERIKQLRNSIKLNQSDFAKRIKISRSALCKIESGENNPSEQTLDIIVREFKVNEEWLRSGTGTMLKEMSNEEELASYLGHIANLTDDSFEKRFVSMLSKLDSDDWKVLEKMALEMKNKHD